MLATTLERYRVSDKSQRVFPKTPRCHQPNLRSLREDNDHH